MSTATPRSRFLLATALSLTSILCAACSDRHQDSANNAAPPPVDREFTITPAGASTPCRVHMSVNTVKATAADRIIVQLEASAPAGWTIAWPEITDALGGMPVLTVDDPPPTTVGGDGVVAPRIIKRRAAALEPFLTGQKTIGPIEVRFTPPSGGSRVTVTTEPVAIEVVSLVSDKETADPELRTVVSVAPHRINPAVWIGSGVAIATALGAAAWTISRSRQQRQPEPLTPLAAALRSITELDDSNLLATGQSSQYCARAGEILRVFIGAHNNISGAGLTTEQLQESLVSSGSVADPDIFATLRRLDELSFAGEGVSPSEAVALRDKVNAFVLATSNESQEAKI